MATFLGPCLPWLKAGFSLPWFLPSKQPPPGIWTGLLKPRAATDLFLLQGQAFPVTCQGRRGPSGSGGHHGTQKDSCLMPSEPAPSGLLQDGHFALWGCSPPPTPPLCCPRHLQAQAPQLWTWNLFSESPRGSHLQLSQEPLLTKPMNLLMGA